ncbi:MAG: hypothetical protein LJE93_01580 [Acidobacteria bacterium]|jgi:hypothetical protein|nr:hypothetical protein [Acidobacteriota bacterium]
MSGNEAISREGLGRQSRRWWIGPPLLFVLGLYFLPLAGSPPATNPNEVARIELAVSLAFWSQIDIARAAGVYGLSEDVSFRDGGVYSDKAPGLSLMAAPLVWILDPILPRTTSSDLPAFWPLRHALTLLLVALPAAGLAFLLAGAVPNINQTQRTALALITALATPIWTYGGVFFGHAPAALLVTLAWLGLLGSPGTRRDLTTSRAVLGGTAAGFAITTEYPTILIVAVIFTTLLVRRTAVPLLVSAAAGTIVGMSPALVYHHLAFGAPWITGYTFKAHRDFQAIHDTGFLGISLPTIESLWGVLFSASRGMLYYCPLLVFVLPGLRRMVHDRGWRDAGPLLGAISLYVLFAAGFVDWQAGWCAAARHLVPILPLALVTAFIGLQEFSTGRWRIACVAILVSISAIHAVLSISLTPFFAPEFTAPFAQLVMPSLLDGVGFANLFSTVSGVASVAVVIMVGAITTVAVVRSLLRVVEGQRLWFAGVSLATVLALLSVYSWGASKQTVEIEIMRSQMLRRLGHTETAERIEASLSRATETPDN